MTQFAPQIDTAMYVVTCCHNGEMAGCLVGFATQCSIRPPRFLVCLSVLNRTYEIARRAEGLAVHVLTPKDEQIASLFGEHSGDNVDKFAFTSWHRGRTGAPILSSCATSFEGRIVSTVAFGDHVGFVLSPLEDVDIKEQQLTLRDVADYAAGHPIDEIKRHGSTR